jgi:CubicO group peptidase (beta-lactamase class C family)
MRTRRWHHMFLALMCLILMTALTIGNVDAGATQQGEAGYAAIDAYVTEQVNRLGIPGLALGMVQDGRIAHLQGFGVADSTGREVTPQTPFYIGSVTKSFTALAIMQLVDAGQIDLDAPVQTYLPWFALADKEAAAQITVRHLLNQTSGISTKEGNRDRVSQQGLEEAVRGLGNVSLTEPVGSTYQYSNLNYNIAGLIVEVVSGQPYADYVAQHIFQPLDMRHAYASRAAALADGLSAGHRYVFGHAFAWEEILSPAHLPSGYLIASAEDMAHYAIAHLNDGRYGDTPILSPPGMAELHAPAIPGGGEERQYAMGWNVGRLDGVPILSHSGDVGTFHSVVLLRPDRGSGFVLLANASGFVQLWQVDDIARGIFRLLNGQPPAPISLPPGPRFLYWAVLLTPLLQIVGIAAGWRHWRKRSVGQILLTVVLYVAIPTLWLFVLPSVLEAPIWSGARININHTELAYALLASAVLGMGWSVIYAAMQIRTQRSGSGLRQR